MKPILKYPGAKWRLMPRILPYIPACPRVVDLYCGSGAFGLTVAAERRPAHLVLNDRDERIVALFRAIREQPAALARAVALTPWSRTEYLAVTTPDADIVATGDLVEDARRFLVVTWQQHGTKLDRRGGWRHKGTARSHTYELWAQVPDRLLALVESLKDAEIEALPALTLIGRYATAATLLYADPPYVRTSVHGTRDRLYRHEMTEADHAELLTALEAHPGPVLLSGYHSALYDQRLTSWRCVELPAAAEHGKPRTECLWLNGHAQGWLGNGPMFAQDEQGINACAS